MMRDKLVKVCGMTEGRNIREIDQLGVDLIGFIFYPKSPRCVSGIPGYLPRVAKRVGVFVDEADTNIQQAVDLFALDYVQLHGHEPAAYCRKWQSAGLSVIKSFAIKGEEALEQTLEYEGSCDYFLFDTPCTSHGGSGIPFDWSILEQYKGKTPFLLSGGIAPDSVGNLMEFNHPQLAGYDINSRFETEPGKKSVEQIAHFIQNIKNNE